MATENKRGYSNPYGSANLGSGVRTTTGGTYRNPRLGIEDNTAFARGFASTFRMPEEKEEEEELKGFEAAFELSGNDFLKDADGNTWSLTQNPLINNNWTQGELAFLQKQYESAGEKGKKRIQAHITGYNNAIGGGENSSFSKYLKYIGDPDVYDHNVSNGKNLPGLNGESSGLTIAQFSKLNSENPNAIKIASKTDKYNVMQYGFEVNGKFVNASAMTDQWLSDNFNVKYDVSDRLKIDSSRNAFDKLKPRYHKSSDKKITLKNGEQFTINTDDKYIQDKTYEDIEMHAGFASNNAFESANDSVFESAWHQLKGKFNRSLFQTSSELRGEVFNELKNMGVDTSKFTSLKDVDFKKYNLSDDLKIRLLKDEYQEQFKITNGGFAYKQNRSGKVVEDKFRNINVGLGRAISHNHIEYSRGKAEKQMVDLSQGVNFTSDITKTINEFVKPYSKVMGDQPEGVGGVILQHGEQADMPKFITYLNQVSQNKNAYFDLTNETSIKNVLASQIRQINTEDGHEDNKTAWDTPEKKAQAIKDLKADLKATTKEKRPQEGEKRVLGYIENGKFQVSGFDGTKLSMARILVEESYAGNKENINNIMKMYTQLNLSGGDIDKLGEWSKGNIQWTPNF